MPSQIHYEVFVRRGNARGFTLVDALNGRDDALAAARDLLAAGKASGVRVVKETFDEGTGEFRSVTIFEDGQTQVKLSAAQEDAPNALPCFSPDDLYGAHARHVMARLFADPLARWKVTVSELIHRADLIEKLESAGSVWQAAVQKVAIAQAQSTGQPVAKVVRALNELAERAVVRLYKDEKAGRFPACETPQELAAAAARVAGQADAAYVLGGATAKYLAPAKSWAEKVARVLAALDCMPEGEAARAALGGRIDAVASETVSGAAAIQELLGAQPELGAALTAMSDLYLGRAGDGAGAGLRALASAFAAGRFPEARTAVAKRVLAELRTHKKLAATPEGEVRHMRAVTARLVMGPPALMPHEDIVAAVTVRSKRLVTPEAIDEWIGAKPGQPAAPDAKAERLLALEENVIGAENKRRVFEFLKPALASPAFEAAFVDGKTPPLARLLRLGEIAGRVARSGFADESRADAGGQLDRIGAKLMAKSGLGPALETAPEAAHVQLALALAAHAVPQPETRAAAKASLAARARDGRLTAALAAHHRDRRAADPDAAAAETLAKAGLGPAAPLAKSA